MGFVTRIRAVTQWGPATRLHLPDLVKVGPKGYVHGWIYVGPHPSEGQLVHQVKKDKAGKVLSERHGEISKITDGRVHITWHDEHGQPTKPKKTSIVQHIHDDSHPGGLMQRHEHAGGADQFSQAHAAGVAASRRRDHAEAHAQYTLAARHALDAKTRTEMQGRADAAAARAGVPAGASRRPEHVTAHVEATAARRRAYAAEHAPRKTEPAAERKPRKAKDNYTGPRYVQPATVDQQEVQALRQQLRAPSRVHDVWPHRASGKVTGSYDPETKRLVARLGPTVANRVAWETDQEDAIRQMLHHEKRPDTPAELERAKKRIAAQLKREFAGKKVHTRVTEQGLERILASGRVKTQFETGTSRGYYKPTKRAEIEAVTFGIPHDSDPTQRPVYGYLDMGADKDGKQYTLLDNYGNVRVVLKDHVRSRTTASTGDTLDDEVIGTPVDNPSWESFSAHKRTGRAKFDWAAEPYIYAEAQIHGGVSTDDIDHVVLPRTPPASLRQALAARGVKWRVLGEGAKT